VARHRSVKAAQEGISFPLLESWNPMTEVATVAAEVNAKRVLCRISIAVLKRKFKASPDNPMQAVADNRQTICEAARRLIEREAYEEDGSIMVRAKDF